jgi:hypothetical protein
MEQRMMARQREKEEMLLAIKRRNEARLRRSPGYLRKFWRTISLEKVRLR